MAAAAEILGANVFDHNGNKIDIASRCAGKKLGIYFSAHWCPPCKGFTPILADFYNKFHQEKNFEIVFVSGDEDEGEFVEYYSTMPWLTVSFDDKEKIVRKICNF
jgi:nucleoredoxin